MNGCSVADTITLSLGLSGTYTIAPAGDYTNFTAVVNDLIANGICGNVTFNVANGTYTERISIPFISGSSPNDTIILLNSHTLG